MIMRFPHIYASAVRLLLPVVCLCSIAAASCSRQSGGAHSQEVPVAELKLLDKAIRMSGQYDARKREFTDSLKHLLAEAPEADVRRRFTLTLEISRSYKSSNADSALKYASVALGLAGDNPADRTESRVALINGLSMSGIFPQALAELDTLARADLDAAGKVEMWKAGRQLYFYMMCYVTDKSPIYESYAHHYYQFDDSLLNNLPRTDSFYAFLSAERAVTEGKYKDAKKTLETLLAGLTPESNLYGMAAFQMAEVYRNQGDETQYAAFLAKAAVSDIEAAVKEGLALPALANWLYLQGRLDEAFDYINFALEDANSGNARMRTVSIASLVPIIDQAYRKKISDSRDRMLIWFLLATFLLILTGVLLFYLGRQIKLSRESQAKLEGLSSRQESYIGSFVSLCSVYADRLDSLSKLVSVKISAGQTDELLKLVKSGRFGEPREEDFYRKIDEAFLDLYPDFVAYVNSLLRDDEQIEVKRGEGLTPELRIYAFVKLGVVESTRIAQILHYSVSTIYAYRNKMRNKAINRDTFEADVASIWRR